MYAPSSTNSPRSGPTSGEHGDDPGGLTDFDGAGEILRAWGNGLRPDPDLTVSEWADLHRMLSGRASAEPGRYRTVRTPYMREIMDRLSPGDPTQRIVFMKAAQVGATEAGNNWIGFAIHQAPGPMLAVQPTVELAKRNSRQRIDPLIDESPELRERVKPARSRDAGNTMLSKEFAGGILIMTGANSAVGLRSTPARYIFLDEVDAYPASADDEGDPVTLAEARSLTFAHRRKVLLVSTPTIRGLSRIEREFEASDQRRFFVPRPTNRTDPMDTMIELPALRRSAELAPNTADTDARTVEVIWSAGARVRRSTLFGEPYDEELSLDPAHVRLDRLNAGAPFLKVHEIDTLDAVIGSVVPGSARIENGRGIALVRISERADVEPIWRDIQAGHIRAVSIGYQVHRFEVSKPEAGRELWRAVDWTPFEVSAVPVGADPAAGFRAQHPLHDCVLHRRDAPTPQGASPMTDKTQTPASDAATPATTQPTEPNDTEDTTMTEPKTPATEPKNAAVETRAQPSQQAAPAPDAEAVATRAREAERDRVSTIYDLAGRLNLERSFAEDLVKRGTDIGEARRLILDQVAAKSEETRTFSQVSIPLGGRDERITRRDAVANALLHRYSPTLFQLEDAARQYRGMTLLELARESLGNAGVNTRGLSRDEVATRALHSTSDFPEILSAVTNKTLRQAYEAYPRTFMLFCRQVLATDFKAMHRVQLGEAPQLLEVGESGEFKRGTLGESKESYKVKTYGRVVAITRQTLINDDLDAFTRIPAMYGNSIAQLESDVVWGIITANPAMADGNALFHANHKNLAGTGTALAVDAVGAARAAMAKQTGLDKKTVLNVRPAFLIVPASLELKAEQLVAKNLVPAATSSVVPQSIRTLQPISEPRLDAASETAWYLAASPNQIDTIEYAYLEGQQGAYIETRNGFDVDGVEIKCRLDFGAKAIDWRGLYKNPGA